MRKPVFFLAAVIFWCAGIAGAYASPVQQRAEAVFSGANALYKDGKYSEAVAGYEKILAAGFTSGNLYYNLGNCYFRAGDPGRAVLNYERALVLLPHDGDAASNYAFIRSQLNLPDPGFSGMFIVRLLDRIGASAGINALTIVVSAAFCFVCILLCAALFIRGDRMNYALRWACIAGCAVTLIAGSLLVLRIRYVQRAVVVLADASVTFAPLESATAYFSLGPGCIVEVLETTGMYAKVRRSDGKIGWINKAAVERIVF